MDDGFTLFILIVEFGIWPKILQGELHPPHHLTIHIELLTLSYTSLTVHIELLTLSCILARDATRGSLPFPPTPTTVSTQRRGWLYVSLTLSCPVAFLSFASMAGDFPEDLEVLYDLPPSSEAVCLLHYTSLLRLGPHTLSCSRSWL